MRVRADQREGRRRRDGGVLPARAAAPLDRLLDGRRRVLLLGLRGRALLLAHQSTGTVGCVISQLQTPMESNKIIHPF